jgi:hypothetical protein
MEASMASMGDDRPTTPGGQRPEQVEDRPNVGTVTPADYPDDRKAGTQSDRPLDADKEHERLNPGDAGSMPRGPNAGRDKDLA